MDQKTVLLKVSLHKFVHLKFFLDPIQKRAPARSVQLAAVYLKALLYSYFGYWLNVGKVGLRQSDGCLLAAPMAKRQ